MNKEIKMNPNSKWYGSKQIGTMLYTAVLFLIGTSIIGGNTFHISGIITGIWDDTEHAGISGGNPGDWVPWGRL